MTQEGTLFYYFCTVPPGVLEGILQGRGVVFNGIFQKGSCCIDLFPNTVYRKCIKFGSSSHSIPPALASFPMPLYTPLPFKDR